MNQERIRAFAWTAAVVALALGYSGPLDGQATALRAMPAEGQVSRYLIGSETSMAGVTISTSKRYQTETVVSAAPDVIEIRTVVDSTTTTEAVPGAGGPDLSGMSYTFAADPRARATGLTDAGTLTPEAEVAVSATLATRFFELPAGEVSPGDSWSGQTSAEIPAGMGTTMTMETDIAYTLVGIDGDLAEISLEGTITMSGNTGGTSIEGSGSVSGTAIFDTDSGRLQGHDSVINMNLTMGGMPASMTTSTTLELIP